MLKAHSYFFYANRAEATFQVAGLPYFFKNEGNKRVVYKQGHDGPDSNKRIGSGKKAAGLLAAMEEFAKANDLALTVADVEAGKKTGKHIVWTPEDSRQAFAHYFK